jgi:hypothetical protein
MNDLRKAAEMALEAFDYHFDNEDDYLNWRYPLVLEAKQALRQALAQEEKREWVGLTDEDKHYLNDVLNLQGRFPIIETIEAKLKEKNT